MPVCRFVADVMHTGDHLPLAGEDVAMSAALVTMTQKSFGCLGVVDAKGKLVGVITDGDLRRHMGADLLGARTGDIMTRKPKVVAPDMLASAALEVLNTSRITALFVVDKGKPVGIVHVHDLLARRAWLSEPSSCRGCCPGQPGMTVAKPARPAARRGGRR